MPANVYEVGDLVRSRGTFKDIDGNLVDPSQVFVEVLDPGGTKTIKQYVVDVEVIRASLGIYYLDVSVDQQGRWYMRWYSTGQYQAAGEEFTDVSRLDVDAWSPPVYAQYSDKVLALSPIAYWPLWEAAGSQAADISGNGLHGIYSDVTLGQPGIGDGETCPYFDGINDWIDLYSAGLAGVYNGAEGSILIWVKAFVDTIWDDGANNYMINLRAGSNNFMTLFNSSADSMNFQLRSGGTYRTRSENAAEYTTAWYCFGMIWSEAGDFHRGYKNGSQVGVDLNGLGTWAGPLVSTATLLGRYSTVGAAYWRGWMAHAAVFDYPLTPDQMLFISTL